MNEKGRGDEKEKQQMDQKKNNKLLTETDIKRLKQFSFFEESSSLNFD